MWYLRSTLGRVKCITIQNYFHHGGIKEPEKTVEVEQDEWIEPSLVVKESVKRSILSTALFEECIK